MKKRILLCLLAALMMLGTILSATSCSAKEDTLIPEGMQSATAYGATYRLYVPTTWSLKILPGISGAYYNVAQQSAVSVAEYPIDQSGTDMPSPPEGDKSLTDYFFERNLLAQIKLMATGEVHLYEEDCIATLLGDANARQYHASATVAGEVTHFLHVIAARDNRFYVFSFTATEQLYEHCMNDVKKMLEHFCYGIAYTPQDAMKTFPTDANIPDGMQIASGNTAQYFFYVPAGWSVNQTSSVDAATAPDGSFVSVVPYMPSSEISVKEYFEKSEEMMTATSGGHYTRLLEKEITIGGGKALQYEYEYTVGGVTYRYLQVVVGYKSMIYNLTYTSLPQNFEANRADVDAMIAAFTFR